MSKEPSSYIADSNLQIIELSWERLFLNVTIRSQYDDTVRFFISRVSFPKSDIAVFRREIPVEPVEAHAGVYKLSLNLAVMDGPSFLENGRWYFTARRDNDPVPLVCTMSNEEAYHLPERSRIFGYAKGKYSYNVYFSPFCKDSVHIIPVMNSRFMIENPNWRDKYSVADRRSVKSKVHCVLNKTKFSAVQAAYNHYAHNRKGKKRILFMSETKTSMSGNLKYIEERIKARGLEDQFDLSYAFRSTIGKSNSIKSWLDTMKILGKSDFIFVDDYAPVLNYLELTDDTKLIQVWHAGEGFKAVGYARFGKSGSPHPQYNCHKKYDYAVTGSDRLVSVYTEVFGLPDEKVLPLGMARLDGFLDEDVIKSKTAKFYADHPEFSGKKLILFSPTFRGRGQKQAHYDYSKLDLKRIYDFCGDEYIWAFKMHPFTHEKPEIPKEFRDRIVDLGTSVDINDLYYVTDIMVTDYSSAYYEFSLMERPILFYTYDREIYELIHGVYKSIKDTAPGKVCDTFDELMTALENKDYELEKTLKFREENFSTYDGHAADNIIDTILLGKES